MERIERPKKVSKLDKQILSKKNFEENTDNQLGKIYDKLDELVDESNIPEEDPIFSEVLWKNEAPTSEFKTQTINLKENKYKYFRIFYYSSTSGNYEFSQVIEAGKGFHATYLNTYTPSGLGHIAIYARRYCSSTQKSITFTDCANVNTFNLGTLNTDNTDVIPVKVVGFN